MNTSTTGSETINPHDVHKKGRRTAPKKRTQPHQSKKKLSLISLLYNSPTNKQQINKIHNNSSKKERNALTNLRKRSDTE